jgi:uncharacterized protein YodC (DUF2158 family)
MKIKVGDVVSLKSGGPKMTVEGIKNKKIKCRWFDNINERGYCDVFVEQTLKELESKE